MEEFVGDLGEALLGRTWGHMQLGRQVREGAPEAGLELISSRTHSLVQRISCRALPGAFSTNITLLPQFISYKVCHQSPCIWG